jgi:hypothetical protein
MHSDKGVPWEIVWEMKYAGFHNLAKSTYCINSWTDTSSAIS